MADLEKTIRKCANDPDKGYRRLKTVKQREVPYCSLLMPQYGDKPGQCEYQSKIIRLDLGSGEMSVYYCRKPLEE